MVSSYSKLTQIVYGLVLAGLLFLGCRRVEEGPSGVSVEPLPVIKSASGIEMVQVPDGWFEMGSRNGAEDEQPVHKVWISSFLLDKYEVTQQQFDDFQMSNFSHFKGSDYPAEQLTWIDAAVFCNIRSEEEGLELCYDEETWECNFQVNGYRLPTEAEWEYACRAGSGSDYFFGNDQSLLKNYTAYKLNSNDRTGPVGSKKPNPWGLCDMIGNVAEWCNDYYSETYYRQSPEKDPRGPETGDLRVLRGGAWNSDPDSCRSAYRTGETWANDDCQASDAIGFRCVKNIPEELPLTPGGDEEFSEEPTESALPTALVYDAIYLEHQTGEEFAESPRRLPAIIDRLKKEGLYNQLYLLGPAAGLDPLNWIRTVHTDQYIQSVENSCLEGLEHLNDNTDMPISPRSYQVACAAVAGVLAGVDAVVNSDARNGFCAIRPPGHHAMPDEGMGFCIFNNAAVAARYIQQQHGLAKVLIVDWDVHHGNGTQAVFYHDPSVMYFGIHQYGDFYPGSGSETEKGMARGYGYTVNVPLPAGSGDDEFIQAFQEQLIPAADSFQPDFVLISAGFDAHVDDRLGDMHVSTAGFAALTQIVKNIADQHCQGRLLSLLEGGYNIDLQAESVSAHIEVLMK